MEKISEQKAMDAILEYLIKNIGKPILSYYICTDVFPDDKKEIVYSYILKIIKENNDNKVIIHKDSLDTRLDSFYVYLEATKLTENFINEQGGFTELYKKRDIDKTEQLRIQELNTKKLESEVDLIDFQKGLGRKLTIWGFVIAILSVLASIGTTFFQNHSTSNNSPKIEALTSRIDSLTDSVQSVKLRLQKVEQLLHTKNINKK